MNEYMCRNYIAEQIVDEMSLTRIRRRLGNGDIANQEKLMGKRLLEDEGSSNYKNWLAK